MADLVVQGEELVLQLKVREKVVGFHGNIKMPLTSIQSVASVAKPWLALRGYRMAGTALRGSTAIGTWRNSEGYDFNVVRRLRPAVQIDVATGRFSRFIICVPEGSDAQAEAERIAGAAGIAPSLPVN